MANRVCEVELYSFSKDEDAEAGLDRMLKFIKDNLIARRDLPEHGCVHFKLNVDIPEELARRLNIPPKEGPQWLLGQ